MNESSDDSFVWTDASSDDKDNNMSEESVIENNGDDSESGYSYKKKIQKELFNGSRVSMEGSSTKKMKKKKHKDQDIDDNDKTVKLSSRCVKQEPESDLDVHHESKRKLSFKVKDEVNETLSHEEFLNMKIKQEQLQCDIPSSIKTKKKKKERRNSNVNMEQIYSQESEEIMVNSQCDKIRKIDISDTDDLEKSSNLEHDTVHITADKKKHKKKKSKKDKNQSQVEDMVIEDLFTEEKTVIQNNHSIKFNKNSQERENEIVDMNGQNEDISLNIEDETSYTHTNQVTKNKRKDKNANQVTKNKRKDKHDVESRLNEFENRDNEETMLNTSKNNISQRFSRISDRIRFEDEASMDSETLNYTRGSNKKDVHSRQYQNYLKANPHLQPISLFSNADCVLTEDDDIWVLNCPHEIDVLNLKDKDITIDNKSKLKVESQTYVGTIESDNEKIAISTYDTESRFLVKNINVKGIINFRKRIPKPHFNEDIMAGNQNEFIPLPETKSRHPLFGVNYKSAIKLPKTIAQRLKNLEMEQPQLNHEKKKKKKKHKQEEKSSDTEKESKPNIEHLDKHHKKRKRKRSIFEESPSRLVKKIKHDPDSAETWESEKAIEKQLFSF